MLTGKTIIVTGAGSGIGRATSRILAHAGAKVLVTDIGIDQARETQALIQEEGGVAEACGVDVADEASVEAMVRRAVDIFGRLDGAFNNAGILMHGKTPDELTGSEWQKVINVNLSGVFYCMKYEIEAMRKTGGGAIVNTSSVNGLVGNPTSIEYVAAKHGVVGATRGAACDAVTTGVRVNAVLPGSIRTPMTEDLVTNPDFKEFYATVLDRHTVGRIGEPEDVGFAVKFLLSDEASFINGAAIAVDGGYSAR